MTDADVTRNVLARLEAGERMALILPAANGNSSREIVLTGPFANRLHRQVIWQLRADAARADNPATDTETASPCSDTPS